MSDEPTTGRAVPTPNTQRIPFGFTSPSGNRVRIHAGNAVLGFSALRGAAKVQWLMTSGASHTAERLWARSVRRLLRVNLEISGADNIKTDTQYIVMPLHEGFMDVPMLLHLPLDLRFTVRQELFAEPALSSYLKATGQIAVPDEPSVSSLRAMYQGIGDAIGAGASVVVFPQGSILGIEVAFQYGAARLAKHFGLSVLPVAIAGTHTVWEFPYSQTVRLDRSVKMTVFEPIPAGNITTTSFREAERSIKRSALKSGAPARRFVPERDGWWDSYDFEIDPDFPELLERVQARRSSSSHQ
ncbi:MAG: lysophospholipid acyltransferase family protein [Actinomycetota bacterium]|nr:lysophospholipid acyltransferase family protein [Actinomycetota bacterium]